MLRDVKNEDSVLTGFKDFSHRFKRIPSRRELAAHLGWKKSKVDRYIGRLMQKGKLVQEYAENNRGISKSLQVV